MTALNDTAPTESHAKSLGLARWVQVAYMVFGLLLMWLLDKVGAAAWAIFAEPNDTLVTAGSFAIAAVVTLALYRHANIHRITHEVVAELAKVTWPSRNETQAATVVVIIASVIASVIIGGFDAAWSAVTDLIY